ncbi:MAG: S1/P1 nuclease [Chthoniobacterales bacterium]
MNRFALLAAGLTALALSVFSARAWDPLGHMLVAQIAYDNLTPAAKTNVDALVTRFDAKDKPDADYNFVTAACWMDDIRSRPTMKAYAAWHYVNLPFTADGMPIPNASAGPNVINGIEKAEGIISGAQTDPAIDKDMATMILLHLVGDIHQPLHTTSKPDDMGGNKVSVGNLKDPLADLIFSKGGNLHFFWDSAYRRIYKEGFATVKFEAPVYDRLKPVTGHNEALALVRTNADEIEKDYPASVVTEQGDAVSWAKESHALGFATGYGKLPAASPGKPIKLTQAYVTEAQGIAEKRIALAGYRLAALINKFYGEPAPASTPAAK